MFLFHIFGDLHSGKWICVTARDVKLCWRFAQKEPPSSTPEFNFHPLLPSESKSVQPITQLDCIIYSNLLYNFQIFEIFNILPGVYFIVECLKFSEASKLIGLLG